MLADACWPGPLTLLVPRAAHVLDVVTGGRPTVGVRVPAHPLTLELLARFGGGLAAPSANRFGRVSPTTAEHVRADLGDDVDFVLDGGPCPIGVESTIVDCTVDPPQVLRPGAIIGRGDHRRCWTSHSARRRARAGRRGCWHRTTRPSAGCCWPSQPPRPNALADHADPGAEVLDDDDLVDYAQSLFASLRDADDRGVETVIAVLPPPRRPRPRDPRPPDQSRRLVR